MYFSGMPVAQTKLLEDLRILGDDSPATGTQIIRLLAAYLLIALEAVSLSYFHVGSPGDDLRITDNLNLVCQAFALLWRDACRDISNRRYSQS